MNWDIDETKGVMWIGSEAVKSLCFSMKKKLGMNFTSLVCYTKDYHFKWCTLESENKKIGNYLVKKFQDKNFCQKYNRDYREFYKKAVKRLNQLDKTDFSEVINKKLFDLLKTTTNLYIKNFDWGFIIEPMDLYLPEVLEKNLKKFHYSTGEIADIFAIADTSFINRENQELIKIITNGKNQNDLIKKHAYKYRWLQSAYMGRIDIPLSSFKKRIDEFKKIDYQTELARLQNFAQKIKLNKENILKNEPVDQTTRKLIRISEFIAPYHDIRKELFLRTIYTVDTIRAEIAKRFAYTKNQLAVFDAKEILKLQNSKKLDCDFANKMHQEGLLYINTKKKTWKYLAGKEAGDFFNKLVNQDAGDVQEIRGMVASTGQAKGKVRIIHGLEDAKKMLDNEIIVTGMTRPEMVMAMKKASAIVTDEGGVTCHASIISRELGIPCIIGTKIATRVLNNGDHIHVDANRGIVKIILLK